MFRGYDEDHYWHYSRPTIACDSDPYTPNSCGANQISPITQHELKQINFPLHLDAMKWLVHRSVNPSDTLEEPTRRAVEDRCVHIKSEQTTSAGTVTLPQPTTQLVLWGIQLVDLSIHFIDGNHRLCCLPNVKEESLQLNSSFTVSVLQSVCV